MAAMLDLIILRQSFGIQAKVRIRTGVVLLCRQLRSRSATLARMGWCNCQGIKLCDEPDIARDQRSAAGLLVAAD
jgi:hypothetical protein